MREFIYTGGPPRKAWRPKAKVWRFLSFWPSLSHAQLNIPWPRSVVGRYAILRALQAWASASDVLQHHRRVGPSQSSERELGEPSQGDAKPDGDSAVYTLHIRVNKRASRTRRFSTSMRLH